MEVMTSSSVMPRHMSAPFRSFSRKRFSPISAHRPDASQISRGCSTGKKNSCPILSISSRTILPRPICCSRFLAKGNSELRLAGDGRVYEGIARAIPFGGFEEEATLGARGQSCEAGFAVGVGSDLEVEFSRIHESVGDVNFDLGGVHRGAVGVRDGEIRGTGADPAVDDGRRFRVRAL